MQVFLNGSDNEIIIKMQWLSSKLGVGPKHGKVNMKSDMPFYCDTIFI